MNVVLQQLCQPRQIPAADAVQDGQVLRKALLHPGEQADRQVLIPAQHGPQVVGGFLGIAVAALLQDLVVEDVYKRQIPSIPELAQVVARMGEPAPLSL